VPCFRYYPANALKRVKKATPIQYISDKQIMSSFFLIHAIIIYNHYTISHSIIFNKRRNTIVKEANLQLPLSLQVSYRPEYLYRILLFILLLSALADW
jgi:hypothetical protein